MTKKPETSFKEKVLDSIRKLPYSYATKIDQMSLIGTPDIFACINSWFVAIELKMDGNVPTPRQKYELDGIKNARGRAFVATPKNWALVHAKLKILSLTTPMEHIR